MPTDWKIIAEPQGKNPADDPKKADGEQGDNEGAMVVYLAGPGFGRQEVSRVGFIRRNTANPEVPFEEQFRAEVDKAQAALRIVNEQLSGDEALR